MIKVVIGNLNILGDNRLIIDGKIVPAIDIPQIANTIWAFSYDEETETGEIEYQDSSNSNLQVTSLAELESDIGCTLQSIKDIHADNWVEPNG